MAQFSTAKVVRATNMTSKTMFAFVKPAPATGGGASTRPSSGQMYPRTK